MKNRVPLFAAGGLFAAVVAGWISHGNGQTTRTEAVQNKSGSAAGDDQDRPADREAIRQAAREFADAFAKGDAKAAAAHWTDRGEYQDDSGELLRGRAEIEKTFADHFKYKPGGKLELRVHSIRFPSKDSAVEEGVIRVVSDGKQFPSSTLYTSIHVREDGKWKIAYSREWGAGQDRLEDLEWLLGSWKGSVGGNQVVLIFERDEKRPYIMGRFAKTVDGKVKEQGTMRIGIDHQRGQIRSWTFDDDGGHGQALWLRDGNNWVMDAIGVGGDGLDHESVNIIGRTNNNEFTWRSIDRVVGDQELPDTAPVKLVRTQQGR